MTVFFDIEQKIIARLLDSTLGYPSVAVNGVFKNQIIFDNDDGNGKNISSGFLYFSVNITDSRQVTINGFNNKHRIVGVIEAGINIPVNTFKGVALEEADKLSTIFRSKEFDNILCFSPSIDRGRNIKYAEGNYYRVNWYCPFKYDAQ